MNVLAKLSTVILFTAACPVQALDIVGPIIVWQADPSTTATVIWMEPDGAEKPAKDQLVVESPSGEIQATETTLANRFGKSKHAIHRVKLKGLKAATDYLVKVERDDRLLARAGFRTAPGVFTPGFRFVTGGDMFHKREWLDAMNRRAGKEDPVFAWLGGDLAYANNADTNRWMEWIDSWSKCAVTPDGRSVPMVMVIGNHEVDGAGYRPRQAPPPAMADQYYSLFQPEGNRSNQCLDFGNYLSLIMLDSGHTSNINTQTPWLRETLEKRSDISRLMVCYHRPAYGTGVKDDAVDIQREWCPVFEEHRVDVVFENDHHCYKRTYPIRAGKRDDETGVPYLGDGAWGVEPREPKKAKVKESPWLAKALAINHLIKVTLTEKGFLYEAVTADGKIFDTMERPLGRK